MLRPPEFLAAHFDALVFLIFLAVTGILRALASKAQKANKRENESQPPVRPSFEQASQESDQERIRRFLEALGQPAASAPPPRVKPRPVITYDPETPSDRARTVKPRRNVLNPLPPLTTVPSPPRRIQAPGRISSLPETETPPPSKAPRAAPEAYRVQEGAAAPVPPATPADAYAVATRIPPPTRKAAASPILATLLNNPDALRQAVLLREILGPPRALSPLEM